MNNKNSPIDFPCHFPIKIIGINTTSFIEEMTRITHKYFPNTPNSEIICQQSKNANYLSITVRIYVDTQDNLDELYRELTQHPNIKMVF